MRSPGERLIVPSHNHQSGSCGPTTPSSTIRSYPRGRHAHGHMGDHTFPHHSTGHIHSSSNTPHTHTGTNVGDPRANLGRSTRYFLRRLQVGLANVGRPAGPDAYVQSPPDTTTSSPRLTFHLIHRQLAVPCRPQLLLPQLLTTTNCVSTSKPEMPRPPSTNTHQEAANDAPKRTPWNTVDMPPTTIHPEAPHPYACYEPVRTPLELRHHCHQPQSRGAPPNHTSTTGSPHIDSNLPRLPLLPNALPQEPHCHLPPPLWHGPKRGDLPLCRHLAAEPQQFHHHRTTLHSPCTTTFQRPFTISQRPPTPDRRPRRAMPVPLVYMRSHNAPCSRSARHYET